MKTIYNHSENFNEPEKIAQDLLKDITDPNSKTSLGFLVCDSEIEYEKVSEIISDNLSFDVIGVTSFKIPKSVLENDISATFMIITKDNLELSIAASKVIDENDTGIISNLYNECISGLSEKPKIFMPLVPMTPGLLADRYMKIVFELAEDVPVFGGMSTDNLNNTEAAIMVNGKIYKDSLVLVALSGDINPVFSVGSQLTPMAAYAPTVTESDENTVKKVDDMTFCEYMESLGISPEKRENGVDALVQYGPLPCKLKHKLEDDDGTAEIRCISYVNLEDGSAVFSSDMPVGTRINMGAIQNKDVEESHRKCVDELLNEIKNTGNPEKFSAILAVPCVARYYALHGNDSFENELSGKFLKEKLPVSSFYGFLEIGPTKDSNGNIHNRSHNSSLVMCAI